MEYLFYPTLGKFASTYTVQKKKIVVTPILEVKSIRFIFNKCDLSNFMMLQFVFFWRKFQIDAISLVPLYYHLVTEFPVCPRHTELDERPLVSIFPQLMCDANRFQQVFFFFFLVKAPFGLRRYSLAA